MRIFLAGATGAVGRPLTRQLVAAGHDVVALTRSEDRARRLREIGAQPVVADAMDAPSLSRAVLDAEPEVVIDQLTDLPQRIGFRGLRRFYRGQNLLRIHASNTLLRAAAEGRARRLISQSVAFIYAPGGDLKQEADPIWADAPEPFGRAARIAAAHDSDVVSVPDLEGVVLRYGVFYGPGTHFAPGNGIHEDVRRGRMPLVGDGASVWSFCHVDDAAQAAVHAIDRGEPGIYNVVDDEPAPMREWLPWFARIIGAKPPRRVPAWLARPIGGGAMTAWATSFPGASNRKAHERLGWAPRFASWRDGFEHELTT